MAGLFISFEGIDGSGKSTQAKLCFDALVQKSIPSLLTREPGGEVIAEKIREILLYSQDEVLPQTEVLLYAAARSQHVRKVIEPALAEDKIVICDRFVHSSIAYQGYGLGVDQESIWQINRFAMGNIFPDIVFLFDLSVDAAQQRSQERAQSRESLVNSEKSKRDRIEARSFEFYQKVRNGFLEMAKDPRVKILDATKTPEAIHDEVISIVCQVYQGGRNQ
ncbi:MAG TPA: dTMP kinase [Firmicutes bacterium]|nr:dTMP kinase [Bacillota bacterium]